MDNEQEKFFNTWLPIENLPEGHEVLLSRPSFKNEELVSFMVYERKKVVKRGIFKKRFETIFVYASYPYRELTFKPTCFLCPSWKGIEKYVQNPN